MESAQMKNSSLQGIRRIKMGEAQPLNLSHVEKKSIILNGILTLVQFTAVSVLIYYRFSTLFQSQDSNIPLTLVVFSEIALAFLWFLAAQYGWWPVFREVFPERLPEDSKLPEVDVFICTADPNKEPTIEVMNTVISAMALDYPAEKLHVYISDDAGSSVTLNALKESWRFCKTWLPFCRRFGLKCRCPESYFAGGDEDLSDDKFVAEKSKVKEEYEMFLNRVMKIRGSEIIRINKDHSAIVEIIDENSAETEMPLLVYTAREKKPSSPHHFKAGALNVLMRVSGLLSNSPYILVLDCDMYCTDASSTRQAMCFNLDPNLSSSLAFVQFPQKFHNVSKNDIYDSQMRSTFTALWHGMDGFRGAIMSGTNFYVKREALYRTSMKETGFNFEEIKRNFGASNMFLNSLKPNNYNSNSELVQKESHILASCTYEIGTTWGKEVGFRYFSVVEDYFTGFSLHCKGWKSVYCNPPNPAFLGTAPISLNDLLVQGSRWIAGLAEVAISMYSPLLYGSSRMSIVQSMCYAFLAYNPFNFLPVLCLATIPQLCLLNSVALYPEVSNLFFYVFAFVFLLSNIRHIHGVNGSLTIWKNEQRMWMIRSVTSNVYGSLHAIMEKLGVKEASFIPTDKVVDDKKVKRYQADIYDFQMSTMFLVPICTLVIINAAALTVGATKMVLEGRSNEMFAQVFLSFFVVAMNYQIVEGMIIRKDNARIPNHVSLLSVVCSVVFIYFGSIIVM